MYTVSFAAWYQPLLAERAKDCVTVFLGNNTIQVYGYNRHVFFCFFFVTKAAIIFERDVEKF